jgi:hypothetical protein
MEGIEKITDLRKFLEALELPPESSNHYLFIDSNGNITLCVSDTEINSPIHAKCQTSMDLFSNNIEKTIVQYLADFWEKSIEAEKIKLQSAQECHLQFSSLAQQL